MPKHAMTLRLEAAVVDDIQYLRYLMRARSSADAVATGMTMLAAVVKAAVADDPELYRNGGTVLSREEQVAWQAFVQDLRHRAPSASG